VSHISQPGGELTPQKTIVQVDTSMITRSDVVSAGGLATHKGHHEADPMSHDVQDPSSKGPKVQGKIQVRDIPQTYQSCIPSAKPNFYTMHIANENWIRNPRPNAAISKRSIATKQATSNRLQGQIAPRCTVPRICTTPCPTSVAGELLETQLAQQAIQQKTLTPSQTQIVGGI